MADGVEEFEVGESSYEFGFYCEVTTRNGKLKYGPYKISNGTVVKRLNVDPPPVFRNVIFDILQEYVFYAGELRIDHTIAYVHVDLPKECDLVCLDVAMLEPEHQIDTKRAILPAKYDRYLGVEIDGETVFFGDVYNSIIQAKWSNNRPITMVSRDGDPHWSQYAGIVDLDFAVSREKHKFKFEGTFEIRRHVLGELVGVAPIPKFPTSTELPTHAIVLATWRQPEDGNVGLELSAAAFDNVNDLTHLLEYRGPQTVWVFGEPGSGKEVFAQALHYGSVVSRGKALRVRSAGGVKLEEFKQRLFASQLGERCLMEQVDGGGTLFLDEFDKLDPENVLPICSTLLRVLEADEYIREVVDSTGRKSESAAKIEEVNWIFAGAFSTISVSESKIPRDFWSRLTGTLEIRHPVSGAPQYAATLFMYFYISEAIRRFGPRHGVYVEQFVRLLETRASKREFNEQITANLLGAGELFFGENHRITPTPMLTKMAMEFASQVLVGVGGEADPVDSSRGIRQAAKAAFFAMRQAAIEGGDTFDFEKSSAAALEAARKMLKISRGVTGDEVEPDDPH